MVEFRHPVTSAIVLLLKQQSCSDAVVNQRDNCVVWP